MHLPQARLDQLLDRFHQVEARMGAATDGTEIVKLAKEHAELKPVADAISGLLKARAERPELEEMLQSGDADLKAMAQEELLALDERLPVLEREVALMLAPKDKDENASAILEVRAGTGGDEAALFAGDLFRMYQRYAQLQGWRVEVDSVSEGEMGGYKEIIASVTGDGVFGRLKFESGVHRVQRVPATETQGRIHTSAATVAVLPEAEDIDVEIKPEEIRIDTMRAGGAGGQHVNKTDSAVRLTHLPTGVAVACQSERSQHQNRARAMAMLKARLYELELKKREEAADAINAAKSDIGWGHQIRSYVLQPYQMVKDLRTDVETSDTGGVLDGDLDPFMGAALAQRVGATRDG